MIMADEIQGAVEDLEAGEGGERSAPAVCDMTTQTEKSAWQIRNDETADKIRREIEFQPSAKEIQDLLAKNWPKEVYRTVKETRGNPVWDDLELNLAIFNEPGSSTDNGINRQVAKRFPDLVALLDERQQDEDIVCLEYTAKLHSKGGDPKDRRRVVMMVKTEEDVLRDHKIVTA